MIGMRSMILSRSRGCCGRAERSSAQARAAHRQAEEHSPAQAAAPQVARPQARVRHGRRGLNDRLGNGAAEPAGVVPRATMGARPEPVAAQPVRPMGRRALGQAVRQWQRYPVGPQSNSYPVSGQGRWRRIASQRRPRPRRPRQKSTHRFSKASATGLGPHVQGVDRPRRRQRGSAGQRPVGLGCRDDRHSGTVERCRDRIDVVGRTEDEYRLGLGVAAIKQRKHVVGRRIDPLRRHPVGADQRNSASSGSTMHTATSLYPPRSAMPSRQRLRGLLL